MKFDVETIRKQAKQLKDEMPELFEYLSERDKATTELVTALYQSKPNPEYFPEIRISLIVDIVEKFAPQNSCPICDENNISLFLLGKGVRAGLCDACKNGVYLRGTGVDSLGSS
ncbi:hypothetical protein [Roseovarius sp. Pro17]|uniref:hypothetical protein n=1 Tax=Roseovarius sp. Pro17 TaxID=3108175 RepID=UPI002D78C0CB|nr:hypothetical protein [Roseovarius sp. Pro17]